mmetsp:Transcript_107074/g.341709  ORF Transcript_107074/g.341709 Transcript_107074/m.341709 type:complete len:403 (+) Transcript_107074:99-1307(+)
MAGKLAMCCALLAALVSVLVGVVVNTLSGRGAFLPGPRVGGVNLASLTPLRQMQPGHAEVVVSLDTPSGNIAVSATGRVIFNFHPEHTEPSGAKFAEVRQGSWIPRKDLDSQVNTVLSLRIGPSDRLYLLDFAFHGLAGTPKMVVFQLAAAAEGDAFLWSYKFPAAVAGLGSMLNDFNLSPDEALMYIADTSVVANTPALVVCDTARMAAQEQDACHRRLEGHPSVMPEVVDINVNGDSPMVLLGYLHLRIAVDSIALDREGRWLYYAPVSSGTLWRVPAKLLADRGTSTRDLENSVERFSAKPITDGMTVDDDGNVLLTAFEHSAVAMVSAGDSYEERTLSVVLRDVEHLQWPDGLSFGPDRWLYVTSSAIHHKFMNREVARHAPFHIVRIKMDAGALPGQ